jgi:hypothetical protein
MKLSLTLRPYSANCFAHPLPFPSFIYTDTERQGSSSKSCSTFRSRLLPASSEVIVSAWP